MKKVKGRFILGVLSLGILAFGGFGINGCVKTPLETGIQTFDIGDEFYSNEIPYARTDSPIAFWLLTVCYAAFHLSWVVIGGKLFIDVLKGSSGVTFSYGSDSTSDNKP